MTAYDRYLPELDPVNQVRVYVRVSHDGASCVMEPQEAEALLKGSPGVYSVENISMTPTQFAQLPDFSGW